jgi:hypothetical protein
VICPVAAITHRSGEYPGLPACREVSPPPAPEPTPPAS